MQQSKIPNEIEKQQRYDILNTRSTNGQPYMHEK